MEYLISVGAMVGATIFILFVKGALAARSQNTQFDFFLFLQENKSRLWLAGLGLAGGSIVMFLDPLGFEVVIEIVRYYSETTANALRFGSPAVFGATIAAVALLIPASYQEDE
ncbi:MAG: hypothetical protein KF855_03550 [Acidobacteria bacterium]|nr:hypothetical protein [Acidobacteriota bacterium]